MIDNKKIYIKSYGCQMNVYDSDRIKNLFQNKGYTETKNIKEASLIVLNTCHIREKASEKVYSDIGRINKIKKSHKIKKEEYKLVVSGCVAQAEGEEIKKRNPLVDYIVGPQSYHKLTSMIEDSENFINDDFLQQEKFNKLIFKSSDKVSEFITVQEGCDKFCAFCVVPYTRGSEFSRPISEIKEEIKKYLENGAKEIILLGQNVNAYHGENQNGKQVDLAYLINTISELDNLKRIRYMTSHPNDMSESLIKIHGDNQKLMPFIHLPIQSGSNEILSKMNRKHNIEKYYKIIDELKSSRSDIAISSDFIVGFPDETDKDFYETMELIQKIKFSIAYSFMYSPRPGTPAYRKDNIDIQIKKARLSAMQSLLKEQQSNYNKKFFKKNLDVLFDRKGRYNNQFVGRTIYNQSVFCSSSKNLIGKILNTKIVDTTNFALEGSI
mgnify:CR=1 FL=1|tara:strand:+ start:146 stop:1462 length:1317 start_codon:yes stop_codon:yes gene_type:complete